MKQDTRKRLINGIILGGVGTGALVSLTQGFPLQYGAIAGFAVSYYLATRVFELTAGKSDTSGFRNSPGSSLDRDFCKKFEDY